MVVNETDQMSGRGLQLPCSLVGSVAKYAKTHANIDNNTNNVAENSGRLTYCKLICNCVQYSRDGEGTEVKKSSRWRWISGNVEQTKQGKQRDVFNIIQMIPISHPHKNLNTYKPLNLNIIKENLLILLIIIHHSGNAINYIREKIKIYVHVIH